jgi:ribokinase
VYAAKLAKKHGVKVLLDAGTFHPCMKKLIGLSDIVIASQGFAGKLACGAEGKSALMKIYGYGPEWAVVTMGARGAVGYDGKRFFSQPAFNVKVTDTTGAGDVYHGAFAYRYLFCRELAEIMRFSSAVAALKCRRLGGRNGIPTVKEVERFMRRRS